jgi:hypothetical protein
VCAQVHTKFLACHSVFEIFYWHHSTFRRCQVTLYKYRIKRQRKERIWIFDEKLSEG